MPSFINNAAAIATPTEKAMVMLFTIRGEKIIPRRLTL